MWFIMETPAEFPGVELSLLTSNFFYELGFSCREKVIMASGQLVFLVFGHQNDI